MKLDLGDQLKGVKKLSKKEKKIVREVIEVYKGERRVKSCADMTDKELKDLLNDCYETDKVLSPDKPNYMIAKHSLTALQKQVETEINNRKK